MSEVDILLVGAGPANLSLLCYLEEIGVTKKYEVRLYEKRENAKWHPDIALKTSNLQVSLLKDVAFMRNPASAYTFFNFLKEKNLLTAFVHLNTYQPSRNLFSNYLEWISEKLSEYIKFGIEVKNVTTPQHPDDNECYQVEYLDQSGEKESVKCKNIVLAQGQEPFVPDVLVGEHEKIFHSSDFFKYINPSELHEGSSVSVIGRGQSAGELVRFLLEETKVGKVNVISRGYLFKSTDTNPFINDTYTFNNAEIFYQNTHKAKKIFLEETENSNFATITDDVLEAIYQQDFNDKVEGRKRLELFPYSGIKAAISKNNMIGLELELPYASSNNLVVDSHYLICSTGYKNSRPNKVLRNSSFSIIDGEYKVNSDFSLTNTVNLKAAVYILNQSMKQHGPTENTLAGLSERAKIVGDSIVRRLEENLCDIPSLSKLTFKFQVVGEKL